MLCCILTLLSGCKDDDDNPLRFYNSEYEVPMGGRRYLGLESGNGSNKENRPPFHPDLN